jgi:hypothetical protein
MLGTAGFGRLLALPLAFASVFAIAAMSAGESSIGPVLAAEIEAGRLLALGGAIAAAWTFDPGDYLRRAWLMGAACFGLLLVADAASLPLVAATLGGRTELYRGLVSLVANAWWIAQIWMLAHAWTVAGFEEPASGMSYAGAALLAAAIEGGPFVHDARAVFAGRLVALTDVAAEIGAAVGLALLVPVMRTAWTMRGGLLRWPWGLLTASGLGWALLDGVTAIGDATGSSGPRFQIANEACRALACGFFCAAGLAQRRAVRAASTV